MFEIRKIRYPCGFMFKTFGSALGCQPLISAPLLSQMVARCHLSYYEVISIVEKTCL